MEDFFKHFETSNAQEREEIANKLKEFYFYILSEDSKTYREYISNSQSDSTLRAYREAITREETTRIIFDIMGIDWEKLDDEHFNKRYTKED